MPVSDTPVGFRRSHNPRLDLTCVGLIFALISTLFSTSVFGQNETRTVRKESADPYFQPNSSPNASGSKVRTVGFESEIEEPAPGKDQQKSAPAASGDVDDRLAYATVVATRESAEANQGKSFEAGTVLAMVGGEPIFVGDMLLEANQIIDKFMKAAPQQIKDQQRPELVKKLLPKYVDQKLMLVDTINNLPENAEFETIVESAAKEFDDKALDVFMKEYGVTSPAELDAQLRARNSSLRQIRRTWSVDQIVRYFLSERLKIDTEVTHQEMLKHYREQHENYAFKARARWQQVMVRFSKYPTRLDAKKAIVAIGNEVVYSPSMEAIAKKSSDGYRAHEGGVHDWTSKGSLVMKELDQALFTLPIGELSDIIETNQGFHIVRVLERTEAGHTPFVEAQVAIKKEIEDRKRDEAFQKHLSELREKIPVEIYQTSLK